MKGTISDRARRILDSREASDKLIDFVTKDRDVVEYTIGVGAEVYSVSSSTSSVPDSPKIKTAEK